MDGLSNSAREELKIFDIGVSVIHPGTVRTRITTSNRLLSEEQRKAQDEVRPWSYYLNKGAEQPKGAAGGVVAGEDPDIPMDPYNYITCKYVGQFVLEGILKNKPHIMTHPLPMPQILKRFNGILEAVPSYTGLKDD